MIFLFWVEMGCRAAETTRNINNAFGPGTANERTVQWWFKKFCRGDERLEARPSETDDNREHHRSWSSYDIRSCQMTQYWPFYCHLEFEANWKGEKVQEVDTCELPTNQKNQSEASSSLILHNNNETFLDGIMKSDDKWIVYNWQLPAQWLDQDDTPKHFPKPNLHQKKVKVTVWWSSASLIHYRILNPSETIIFETYAEKINQINQNCNACSQHWSKEGAQFFSMTMSGCMYTTNTSKVETIWLQSFASSTIFTWPPANQLPLLQASQQFSAGKKLPQPVGCRKCFPKVHRIPKHRFLHYRNKLISHWQKCVD